MPLRQLKFLLSFIVFLSWVFYPSLSMCACADDSEEQEIWKDMHYYAAQKKEFYQDVINKLSASSKNDQALEEQLKLCAEIYPSRKLADFENEHTEHMQKAFSSKTHTTLLKKKLIIPNPKNK